VDKEKGPLADCRAEAKVGHDIEAGELLTGRHDLARHAMPLPMV
jgi:hypothetical protein